MEMRRISSRLTSFYKKTLPVIFGGAFLVLCVLAWSLLHAGMPNDLGFLAVPLLMVIVSYLLCRNLVAHMVDEVWLEGEAIVVKNGDELAKIPLSNVTNVDAKTTMNPRRITLTLRSDTPWGRQITFMPAVQTVSVSSRLEPDPIATELSSRIDALRISAS